MWINILNVENTRFGDWPNFDTIDECVYKNHGLQWGDGKPVVSLKGFRGWVINLGDTCLRYGCNLYNKDIIVFFQNEGRS